jgi:hypothetical protein
MHRMRHRDRKARSTAIKESIMKVKQLFALSALALATGAVLAQEAPVTRAEVVQSVLAARAAGTLIPAGQGVTPGYPRAGAPVSSLTRAQVKSDVAQARADGELVPAGNGTLGDETYARAVAAPSTLARDQVKDEVLQARADGTLIPAGQGEFAGPESGAVHLARHATPATSQTAAIRTAH